MSGLHHNGGKCSSCGARLVLWHSKFVCGNTCCTRKVYWVDGYEINAYSTKAKLIASINKQKWRRIKGKG